MTTVAHSYPFVIGVDTHARTHTYAVLAANGEHLGTEAFPNSHAGRARAIGWAARRTGGDLGSIWIIEGAGSYGALLAGTVALAALRVLVAARGGR